MSSEHKQITRIPPLTKLEEITLAGWGGPMHSIDSALHKFNDWKRTHKKTLMRWMPNILKWKSR